MKKFFILVSFMLVLSSCGNKQEKNTENIESTDNIESTQNTLEQINNVQDTKPEYYNIVYNTFLLAAHDGEEYFHDYEVFDDINDEDDYQIFVNQEFLKNARGKKTEVSTIDENMTAGNRIIFDDEFQNSEFFAINSDFNPFKRKVDMLYEANETSLYTQYIEKILNENGMYEIDINIDFIHKFDFNFDGNMDTLITSNSKDLLNPEYSIVVLVDGKDDKSYALLENVYKKQDQDNFSYKTVNWAEVVGDFDNDEHYEIIIKSVGNESVYFSIYKYYGDGFNILTTNGLGV